MVHGMMMIVCAAPESVHVYVFHLFFRIACALFTLLLRHSSYVMSLVSPSASDECTRITTWLFKPTNIAKHCLSLAPPVSTTR